MSTHRRNKAIYAAASLAAVAWLPTGAYAAQPGGQSVAGAIEEVLVTARRREESLQDVPIAISAIGGDDLQQRGVESVANMNAIVPNLSVAGGGNSGESQASFRVRGVPGVSVYIDGVNQATTDGLMTMSVVEVDRIEVLRGPQGTLFGNASLGGAIQYITRAPADKFGARIQGSVGSYNRRDFQAAVDMPLSDTFKTKLTVASLSREGYINSVVIDRAYGDVNDELARADFLWTPIDSLSIRYNAEKSTTDRVGPARVVWEVGPTTTFTANGTTFSTNANVQAYTNATQGGRLVNGFTNIQYNNANNSSGQPYSQQLGKYDTRVAWETNGLVIDSMRHTLDVNWDVADNFRVRSISGYKELTRAVQVDFDGAAEVIVLERDNRGRFFSFSQELQLLGSTEKVDWVLGGYFSKENNRARTVTWGMPEFTCDMWAGSQSPRVTNADRAACLANRNAALGTTGLTQAQLVALNPNLNGVTMATFSGAAASNSDQMTITNPETTAYFGDVTWRATDKLTVAAGMRYSKDKDPGSIRLQTSAQLASRGTLLPDTNINNYYGFLQPLPARTGASEFDALTKRLTLQYQWNPDIMTYVSYSDGYGPGGVSNTTGSIISYMAGIQNGLVSDLPNSVSRDEQTVKNYELGLRADWLGGRLRTNVTAFFTDWTNVPVSQYVATKYWDTDGNGFPDSTIDTGTGNPENNIFFFPSLWTVAVDKAESKGVEIEGVWAATDNLRFNMAFGYLDAVYKELGQAGQGVVPAVTKGSRFAGAPKYTANFAATYAIPLAGGASLTPRLDYTWTDSFTLQTGDVLQRVQEAYGLLNARLTYDTGSNWNVALTGSNLTDEYYFNSGFYTRSEQIHFMTVGRPREWGLTFNFKFE
jgi:iron complex outermembrane recepter protein